MGRNKTKTNKKQKYKNTNLAGRKKKEESLWARHQTALILKVMMIERQNTKIQ